MRGVLRLLSKIRCIRFLRPHPQVGARKMSDPRRYLLAAFDAMLAKAYSAKNLPKPTWIGMTRDDLIDLLCAEIKELEHSIRLDGDREILFEAADVMAFAAMLATRNPEEVRGT